jgi:hypothetical protein
MKRCLQSGPAGPQSKPILCSGPLANPFASARLYGSVLAPGPKGLSVCTISVPVGLSPKGRSEATALGSKDSPTGLQGFPLSAEAGGRSQIMNTPLDSPSIDLQAEGLTRSVRASSLEIAPPIPQKGPCHFEAAMVF